MLEIDNKEEDMRAVELLRTANDPTRMAHAMIIAASVHLVYVGGIEPTIETLLSAASRAL